MGLQSIIKKLREKEKEVRILVLGLDNAGKTTIMKRVNGEPIDTISPTLGFNITTLELDGYKVNFWDVGGQKTIRAYWRNYFEQTDGIIWVVDSADRQRIDVCREELSALLKQDRLAGASLLVFANKQDIQGAMTENEIRNALGLDSMTTHHWSIRACSAVTGNNLLDGITWIVNDIASHIYMFASK
ncbi:ADP-ribosylation factor-like protein 2 [Coemansia sp. RSA 1813]|nr:ADP-ribosylation factor-like protein 2 [Coemansia sp. RSA 1646]KAJ1771177.1 ADP-ribosylation factor-like protein 2 [Coemansia sp. RSA 1843]KAJ2087799.1 ADP-ribosylation factor-like protein 2 [Coemansia sp. RSA 986]KAJ2212694.1 ADP-ribosylation factor-like protein 2 [Coemansia sp. RSA 487]KAJ2567382.1 ADP-ribosylation factor-like protein 2 [Coemansia sp. RSA 1813]